MWDTIAELWLQTSVTVSFWYAICACVLTCTCITWKLHWPGPTVYMDVLHMKRLLYYQRHSLCVLELHERSEWRATAPGTNRLFPDTTLCVYMYAVHHSLGLNYTFQNSHTLWLYDSILCTKWRLYWQWWIILYEQSWLATLHVAVSFQLIGYANWGSMCYNNWLQVVYLLLAFSRLPRS